MYPTIQLYKHKKLSDGKYPVIIQIIHKRKIFKKTLFSIDEKYWDSKNNKVRGAHILHYEYNDLISQKLYDTEKKCIEFIKAGKEINSEVFEPPKSGLTIITAIDDYMEIMKSNGSFHYDTFNPVKEKIINSKLPISIDDINELWMQKFYNYVSTINKHNTVVKNIKMIKTVLRYLNKENIFMDNKVLYFKIGYKKTTKNKLSKTEFLTIRDMDLPSGLISVVRDCFVFAFYMRGLRIGDVLTIKKDQIINGRLVRFARKTDKSIDTLLVPKALEIIEKYLSNPTIYVFPIMKMEVDFETKKYTKAIEAKTALVNKYLKMIAEMAEIEKNVTSHIARHTFAYLADQSGMSSNRIKDLLNHSDLQTTQIYINDLNNSDILDKTMETFFKDFLEDK